MYEPKLRFTADDGSKFPDWEEKVFGNIADYKKGPFGSALKKEIFVPKTKETVKVYEQQNAIYKDWKLERYFISNEYYQSKMKSFGVSGGDIIISCAGTIGEIYELPDDAENGVINQALMRVRIKKRIINSIIFKVEFDKMISTVGAKISNGSALKNIPPFADMKKQPVILPSLPEQQKIADFLSTIDTVIEKQKAIVEAWEERKKGVMQKLFSQEVRFKADDGSEFPDWEEKSFEQTFSNLNNSTFSRDCLNYENGNVKYIHYGDILVKFGATVNVTDCIVPYVNDDLNCEKYNTLENGDVVIADTAEDETVGKVVEISETDSQKIISGLHTIACRPREKFASKYLGYFMNSDAYHNQLRPYMQGIKVTSISKANIKLTSILIPCLAEQQKIADCLSALDDVIDKQKATLATWKEMKKGLLQQMFV